MTASGVVPKRVLDAGGAVTPDWPRLWNLDPENRRICIIEKTESGRAPASE